MDRKEFILKVLQKGRLDINGFFSNCFLFPDIPDEKVRKARKMHGIDKDEDILFLRDLTQSGSAEESIVATQKGLSYVLEKKAVPLKESWDEIIKIEFHNGKFFFFFGDEGEDEKDDMDASEFTGCDQKGPNKFFAGLLTEIASEFQDEDLGIQEDRLRKDSDMDRKEFILNVLEKGKSEIEDIFIDCFLFPEIPEKKLKNARITHELSRGENIFFLRDLTILGSAKESIVITEIGVSSVGLFVNPKGPSKKKWEEIFKVECHHGNFVFFFDEDDEEDNWEIEDWRLTGFDEEEKPNQLFSELLTEIASAFQDEEDENRKEIMDAFYDEDYGKALRLTDEYLQRFSDSGAYYPLIKRIRAEICFKKGDCEAAYQEIGPYMNFVEEVVADDDDDRTHSTFTRGYALKAEILTKMGRYYEALRTMQVARDNEEDAEDKSIYEKNMKQIYDNFVGRFLDTDYQDRKLVFVNDSFSNFESESFRVLSKEKFPQISFPSGHPVSHELYIGHPYNPEMYVPYSNHEFTFFLDRVNEYCYLLQCLGAVEFTIESIQGESTQSSSKTEVKMEYGGETAVASAKGGFESEKSRNETGQSERNISISQKFHPTKAPYVPPNLVWYKNEASWQRLVEQRVNGGLLQHEELISTEQNQIVTGNEENKVKGEMARLFMKVGGERELELETQKSLKGQTVWKVKVQFAPVNELTEKASVEQPQAEVEKAPEPDIPVSEDDTSGLSQQVLELPQSEQTFIDELRFMLADDGIIDPNERSILARKQKKLKITDERAQELEDMIMTGAVYSANAREYFEELEALFQEKPDLSPANRRLLDRLVKQLGLDEDIVDEIEKIARAKYVSE